MCYVGLFSLGASELDFEPRSQGIAETETNPIERALQSHTCLFGQRDSEALLADDVQIEDVEVEGGGTKPGGVKPGGVVVPIGDPRIEEMAEYKTRMGRWRREIIAAILDPLFKPIIRTVSAPHCPLDHFLNFMQSKLPQDELCSHLALLTKYKAKEILEEMSDLIAKTKWLEDACDDDHTLIGGGWLWAQRP